jgi:hypothetical protein
MFPKNELTSHIVTTYNRWTFEKNVRPNDKVHSWVVSPFFCDGSLVMPGTIAGCHNPPHSPLPAEMQAQLPTLFFTKISRILWGSQGDDHPKNNLAKFGYILDMKVFFKKTIILYSWLSTRTYHKTLVIWIFIFLKSANFEPFFSMKNHFYRLKPKCWICANIQIWTWIVVEYGCKHILKLCRFQFPTWWVFGGCSFNQQLTTTYIWMLTSLHNF